MTRSPQGPGPEMKCMRRQNDQSQTLGREHGRNLRPRPRPLGPSVNGRSRGAISTMTHSLVMKSRQHRMLSMDRSDPMLLTASVQSVNRNSSTIFSFRFPPITTVQTETVVMPYSECFTITYYHHEGYRIFFGFKMLLTILIHHRGRISRHTNIMLNCIII